MQAPFSIEQIGARLQALAMGVAVLVGLAPSVGYYAIAFASDRERLEVESSILGTRVAKQAFQAGALWKFQKHIIADLIRLPESRRSQAQHRVVAIDGALIFEAGVAPAWPTVEVSIPILIDGAAIAYLSGADSMRPVLVPTALIAVMSLVLAGVIYFHLHVKPVRMLHQTMEALNAALVENKTASRTKSEFLANMSHELRTPLNAIIGFAQMIEAQMLGPLNIPRYREYAVDIAASGGHLLQLINDILDLSKVEAGKLELHIEPVDIVDMILRCERIMAPRVQGAGLALSVTPEGDIPPIAADELRVKQIVINLISNAVKFTPRGGRVTVRVKCWPDGFLRIAVADTGVGMSKEEIPIALERFRQVDGSHTRKVGGTGLGLPITKALVEQHGGRLDIESAPGKGTTVTASLPVGVQGDRAALARIVADKQSARRRVASL